MEEMAQRMTAPMEVYSIFILSHPLHDVQRKRDLVELGLWAVVTGRGWLVRAVHAALVQEDLRHA
jgi:hypothetical protein